MYAQKKICMEKNYMNILAVGVRQPFGSRKPESPENSVECSLQCFKFPENVRSVFKKIKDLHLKTVQ